MSIAFNTKLTASFVIICLSSILSMGFVANVLLNDDAHELGVHLAQNLVSSTIKALDSKIDAQNELVALGMRNLQTAYENGAEPGELVRAMLADHKLYTTVFKKTGDDYVRTATTIPTRDGSDPLGTKLARNSDAYRAVAAGNTWHGERVLLGNLSIVEYRPIDEETVLYVGLPIIDEAFATYLKGIRANGRGYMYLFFDDGTFAWHPEAGITGTSFASEPYAGTLLAQRNGLVDYEMDGTVKYAYVGTDESTGLHIGFGLTGNEIKFGLDKDITRSAIVGGGAALAISAIIAFLVLANIRKILKSVEGMAKGVAEGRYDDRVPYAPKDNIRSMLDALEAMAEQIKRQIDDVRAQSDEATKAKGDAESALERVQAAQKEIEAKNRTIQAAAREARMISENMSSTATELSAQVEQVSQGAEHQKLRVTEVATAIEEMAATVMEVAKNAGATSSQADGSKGMAQDGMDIMGQTINAIGGIKAIDEASDQAMADLADKADAVGGIISVIEDIADQTNLLALNAAIEAARAGDAGRGFAVVADEVRKLAEKTMTATKEVGDSIHEIQDAVGKNVGERDKAKAALDETVASAQQVNELLTQIVDSIVTSADMSNGIATATEQQSAATEQISASVEEVDRISGETTDAMRESSKAVHELAELAESLNVIIHSLDETPDAQPLH